MAERSYLYEQGNSTPTAAYDRFNSSADSDPRRTLQSSLRLQEREYMEQRKRAHSRISDYFGQEKIKVEEFSGKGENQLLNKSKNTVASDDGTAVSKDGRISNKLSKFKSYEDIYRHHGNDVILTDGYRCAANEALKVTAEYPEEFRGFNVAPAIPAFVLENREARESLAKRLLSCCRRWQLHERCLLMVRLAAPELLKLRKSGKEFSVPNMRPIFQKVIEANSWSHNSPSISVLLHVASAPVIANALRVNDEEDPKPAQHRKENLSRNSRRRNAKTTLSCSDERAAKGPELALLDTVFAGDGKNQQVPSDLVELRQNRVASWISSARSLPSEISESPATSSSRSATAEARSNLFEQILSEMDQIPIADWDRRIANLKKEANTSRLVQMLETTMGLPCEEQLTLIRRAVTRK